MYRVIVLFLFISFQAPAQNNFAWVSNSDEEQTQLFPNIAEVFTSINTWQEVSCNVSEHTITTNALSEKHYNDGMTGCHEFISPDGEYGPYAHEIVNHIKTFPYDENEFLKDDFPGMEDGLKICPSWKKLTLSQKFDFWVWTFASIAWDETRCLPDRINKNGTDDIAVGLFQLNQSRKQRYWRGGKHTDVCGVKDIAPVDVNIQCSVEIMNEILKAKDGEYKGSGAVYGKKANTYWESFRKDQSSNSIDLLREFKPCHQR